jgi:hypothetical protein
MSFAVTATIYTGRGLGPLSNFPDSESRVIGLQAFIMTTAFVAFLVYATLSERRVAEVALTELATHDPLTGIANRREFMERLEQVTSRRSRSSESAAVVYFDLDGFKGINDGLGELLRQFRVDHARGFHFGQPGPLTEATPGRARATTPTAAPNRPRNSPVGGSSSARRRAEHPRRRP